MDTVTVASDEFVVLEALQFAPALDAYVGTADGVPLLRKAALDAGGQIPPLAKRCKLVTVIGQGDVPLYVTHMAPRRNMDAAAENAYNASRLGMITCVAKEFGIRVLATSFDNISKERRYVQGLSKLHRVGRRGSPRPRPRPARLQAPMQVRPRCRRFRRNGVP